MSGSNCCVHGLETCFFFFGPAPQQEEICSKQRPAWTEILRYKFPCLVDLQNRSCAMTAKIHQDTCLERKLKVGVQNNVLAHLVRLNRKLRQRFPFSFLRLPGRKVWSLSGTENWSVEKELQEVEKENGVSERQSYHKETRENERNKETLFSTRGRKWKDTLPFQVVPQASKPSLLKWKKK